MPIDCPNAQKQNESFVLCGKLTEACGFRVSFQRRFCEACLSNGRHAEPVETSPQWAAEYRGALESRLISGDVPLYQEPNPVDLQAAFAKFKKLAQKPQQRALLKRMFRRQAALPPDRGGHPPEVTAEKIEALAKAHGMEDVIQEIREEYGNAHARRNRG